MGLGNLVKSAGNFLNGNAGAAVIGGVGSLVSGALDRHAQKDANKANIYLQREQMAQQQKQFEDSQKFNAEQSQLSRLFTTSEREAQQKWQERMMQKQNDYDSPVAQLQRAQLAGLNPNMVFGNGSVAASASPTGTPSGASSPAASVSPAGAVPSANVSPLKSLFDARQIAEIGLINAQRSKVETDTDSEKIKQKYLDQIYSNSVERSAVDIELARLDKPIKEKQAKKLDNEINYLDKQQQELDAVISNLQKDGQLKDEYIKKQKVINDHMEERLVAELREIYARTDNYNASSDMLREHAKYLVEQTNNAIVEGKILGIQYYVDDNTKNHKIEIAKTARDHAKFDYQFAKDHQEEIMWINMSGQITSAVTSALMTGLTAYGLTRGRAPMNSMAGSYNGWNGTATSPNAGNYTW